MSFSRAPFTWVSFWGRLLCARENAPERSSSQAPHGATTDRPGRIRGRNTLVLLLHETGHVHIAEMNLQVLGREEDAADTFAALTMLKIGTSFSQHELVQAAKGWFLNDLRDQQTGKKPLYYGEHNLNQQRAYQIPCLMVGSDPDKFKSLADEMKVPESRQKTCKRDFAKTSAAWGAVLMAWHLEPG
jgi:hypothetical protein